MRNKRAGIVHNSEWLRVAEEKTNVRVETSRLLEPGVNLDPADIEKRWPGLSLREKLNLCAAYQAKPTITEQDEKLLDFIMREGDELIFSSIASVLTRHRDTHRVAAFICERIAKQAQPLANFYQAIEKLAYTQCIPQLLVKLKSLENAGVNPLGDNKLLSIDFLYCCRALWKLTGSVQYFNKIKEFTQSTDEIVRGAAKRLATG